MNIRRRNLTLADQCIRHLDQTVRTLFAEPAGSGRPNPAEPVKDGDFTAAGKAESISLMRVNHAGEVCAQALYQGQALTARQKDVRLQMQQAAREENDHLAWCRQRLDELGGYTSLLNPLWYTGSFLIGAATGTLGDKWSLGFLAETEQQVGRHLEGHLRRLPANDNKSQAILEQMKTDEAQHRHTALMSGAAALPEPARKLMTLMSRVMTATAYRI